MGHHNRDPVLSFFMATLALLADFSDPPHFLFYLTSCSISLLVSSHFLLYLTSSRRFLPKLCSMPPISLCCVWRSGHVSRAVWFLVSAIAFTTLSWRPSTYGIMLQLLWFTALLWRVSILDVVWSSLAGDITKKTLTTALRPSQLDLRPVKRKIRVQL